MNKRRKRENIVRYETGCYIKERSRERESTTFSPVAWGSPNALKMGDFLSEGE